MGEQNKHSASIRLALRTYHSAAARILLERYSAARERDSISTADEWAGAFLMVHGPGALAAFDRLDIRRYRFGDPERIRRLIAEALDAELVAKHGQVSCELCELRAYPTMAWRCRLLPGEVVELWLCPRCVPGQRGAYN